MNHLGRKLLVAWLTLQCIAAPASADPAPRPDGETRILRGIIKLPHEREQALMEKLGVTGSEGFLNCICQQARYGSSSTSQFWHPDTIGKYDKRYSCNRPGDPCVVSGFGCMRFPKPSDPAIYDYCAIEHPQPDGSSITETMLRSVISGSSKSADDYRRELAACRERHRFQRESDYLGGDRIAGARYLAKKKLPLIPPPTHMHKDLNEEAERLRVERVKSVQRAHVELRKRFEALLVEQFKTMVDENLGNLGNFETLGTTGKALANMALDDAKRARIEATQQLRTVLLKPGVEREEASATEELRRANKALAEAREREEHHQGTVERLDKALKVLERIQLARDVAASSQKTIAAAIDGDGIEFIDALVDSSRILRSQLGTHLEDLGDLEALRNTLARDGVSEAEFQKLAPMLESGDKLTKVTAGMDMMLKQYDRARHVWNTMKSIESGLQEISYVDSSGGYSEAQKNLLKGFVGLSELTRKGAEFLPSGASDMMLFYAEAMKLPAVIDEKIRKITDRHDVSAEIVGTQAGSRAMAMLGSGTSLDRDDYLFRVAGLKAYVIWAQGGRAYGGDTPYILIPEADGEPYPVNERNYRALAEMAYYYPMVHGRRLTDADVAEYLRSLGPNGSIDVSDLKRAAEQAQTEAAEDARIAAMFGKETLSDPPSGLGRLRDKALEKSGLAGAAETAGMDVQADSDKAVWAAFRQMMRDRLPVGCSLSDSTQKALFNQWRTRGKQDEIEAYLARHGEALKLVDAPKEAPR